VNIIVTVETHVAEYPSGYPGVVVRWAVHVCRIHDVPPRCRTYGARMAYAGVQWRWRRDITTWDP